MVAPLPQKEKEKKRGVLLQISCLRFGITCFELGLSILALETTTLIVRASSEYLALVAG